MNRIHPILGNLPYLPKFLDNPFLDSPYLDPIDLVLPMYLA
jgi:hypothetical protein